MRDLEAVDGTPIVDVKPVLGTGNALIGSSSLGRCRVDRLTESSGRRRCSPPRSRSWPSSAGGPALTCRRAARRRAAARPVGRSRRGQGRRHRARRAPPRRLPGARAVVPAQRLASPEGRRAGVRRRPGTRHRAGPVRPAGGPRARDVLRGRPQQAGHAAVMRRILREGNTIGNHSLTHANLAGGGRFARFELHKTTSLIHHATGFRPCLFRAPYGSVSARLVREARAAGMLTIQWDVDPRDYAPGRVARFIAGAVSKHVRDGSIVVLHDGPGGRATDGARATAPVASAAQARLQGRGDRPAAAAQAGVPACLSCPRPSARARRSSGARSAAGSSRSTTATPTCAGPHAPGEIERGAASAASSSPPTAAARRCGSRPTTRPDPRAAPRHGRVDRDRRRAGAQRAGTASRSSSRTAAGSRCATSAGSGGRCSSPTARASGPDAAEISRAAFRERVGRGRAPLKARLMDQSVIAGVGNLLADEILWQARLDPAPPGRRARPRTSSTACAGRSAPTLRDDDPPRRRPHRRLHARPRAPRHLPALRRAEVARATVGGRTTYWCPDEQI